jgi:hypothetical protein
MAGQLVTTDDLIRRFDDLVTAVEQIARALQEIARVATSRWGSWG